MYCMKWNVTLVKLDQVLGHVDPEQTQTDFSP